MGGRRRVAADLSGSGRANRPAAAARSAAQSDAHHSTESEVATSRCCCACSRRSGLAQGLGPRAANRRRPSDCLQCRRSHSRVRYIRCARAAAESRRVRLLPLRADRRQALLFQGRLLGMRRTCRARALVESTPAIRRPAPAGQRATLEIRRAQAGSTGSGNSARRTRTTRSRSDQRVFQDGGGAFAGDLRAARGHLGLRDLVLGAHAAAHAANNAAGGDPICGCLCAADRCPAAGVAGRCVDCHLLFGAIRGTARNFV